MCTVHTGRRDEIGKKNYPVNLPALSLTWDNGVLRIVEDFKSTCDCLSKGNISLKNIFETQKREIEDIFEILPEEPPHLHCTVNVIS